MECFPISIILSHVLYQLYLIGVSTSHYFLQTLTDNKHVGVIYCCSESVLDLKYSPQQPVVSH